MSNNKSENEKENSHELLEMFIIIIFVISLLGAGIKTYNNIQATPTHEFSGPCGIAGMTEKERIECLKTEEGLKQNAIEADTFLTENKSNFIFTGIICLLGTFILLSKSNKYKLKTIYSILGILSIICSVLLIL